MKVSADNVLEASYTDALHLNVAERVKTCSFRDPNATNVLETSGTRSVYKPHNPSQNRHQFIVQFPLRFVDHLIVSSRLGSNHVKPFGQI